MGQKGFPTVGSLFSDRLLAIIPLLFCLVSIAPATVLTPTETVSITAEKVLEALSNPELDDESRRSVVVDLIADQFDFYAMGRSILAINWNRATPEQRQRFAELFRQILTNTYWASISPYKNERVDFVREKIRKEKYAQVDTIIVTDKNRIPVDYKLFLKGDVWKGYDVVIEQVSLVNNYRGSFAEVVDKDGIDGLLNQMEAKVSSDSGQ